MCALKRYIYRNKIDVWVDSFRYFSLTILDFRTYHFIREKCLKESTRKNLSYQLSRPTFGHKVFKNQVLIKLGWVRQYETVRSFSLISAGQNCPIELKLSGLIPLAISYLVKSEATLISRASLFFLDIIDILIPR